MFGQKRSKIMETDINYHNIPKDTLRELRKSVVRANRSIRWWSALSCALAVLVSGILSAAAFPQKADLPGKFIIGVFLAAGLGAIFWKSVVDPQIIRAVESHLRDKGTQHDPQTKSPQ